MLEKLGVRRERQGSPRHDDEVALLCSLEVGADLLVYTPEEVEHKSRENASSGRKCR
jgi:hypothetical protein